MSSRVGDRVRYCACSWDAERVARYIADHPGSRAEDIATALGTGTAELRPALMKLKTLGAVEPKGKARATGYYAVAG